MLCEVGPLWARLRQTTSATTSSSTSDPGHDLGYRGCDLGVVATSATSSAAVDAKLAAPSTTMDATSVKLLIGGRHLVHALGHRGRGIVHGLVCCRCALPWLRPRPLWTRPRPRPTPSATVDAPLATASSAMDATSPRPPRERSRPRPRPPWTARGNSELRTHRCRALLADAARVKEDLVDAAVRDAGGGDDAHLQRLGERGHDAAQLGHGRFREDRRRRRSTSWPLRSVGFRIWGARLKNDGNVATNSFS